MVKKDLEKIKPYFGDVIVDLQESGLWKVQLPITINSNPSNDLNQENVIHLKSYDLWWCKWYCW